MVSMVPITTSSYTWAIKHMATLGDITTDSYTGDQKQQIITLVDITTDGYIRNITADSYYVGYINRCLY